MIHSMNYQGIAKELSWCFWLLCCRPRNLMGVCVQVKRSVSIWKAGGWDQVRCLWPTKVTVVQLRLAVNWECYNINKNCHTWPCRMCNQYITELWYASSIISCVHLVSSRRRHVECRWSIQRKILRSIHGKTLRIGIFCNQKIKWSRVTVETQRLKSAASAKWSTK